MKRAAALLAALVLALAWLVPVRAADIEARYQAAAADFHRLEQQPTPAAADWRNLAERFRAIYTNAPQSRRGPDALYSAGLAYRRAWQVSVEWRDLSHAVAQFREFARRYAANSLADDALMHLAALQTDGFSDLDAARDTYRHLLAAYPDGDQHTAASRRLAALQAALAARKAPSPAPADAGGLGDAAEIRPAAVAMTDGSPGAGTGASPDDVLALEGNDAPAAQADGSGHEVREVQHWSAPDLTRVILTTDPGVPYTVNRIPADKTHPQRLYLDLQGQPADGLPAVTAVNGVLLRSIRIGRHNDDTTRVVMDLTGLKDYDVKDFRLPMERKIVVDLHPRAAVAAAARRKLAAQPATQGGTAARPQFASQALPPEPLASADEGLQVHSIMIDPGHGGHDPGALGFGLEEKNLTLQIARDLRDLIRRRSPNIRVGMTRDSDVFIPLQERPEIASRFGADLFVSIHVNANPIHRFHGVETYFLNLTHDRHALQVAARENETSEQGTSELNNILHDLLRDSTLIESSDLAKTVQASLVSTLRGNYGPVRNLGVKQAPFLVLMGSDVPSVLVEVGFITNKHESGRLRNPHYLEEIAEGIYDGLGRYIHQQNIVAARRHPPSVAANAQP